MQYTNIAYYKFITLDDISRLRIDLLNLCERLSLKGTIILASEGINSCLVGEEGNINQYISFLQSDPRFADIDFKKSFSNHIPFRRMLVKIKKETIPLGMENIKPSQQTGSYISPLELLNWYDNKEDFIILDTRNQYEVELGTFVNAINPQLKEFRQFPQWIRDNFMQYKDKKIVTFCTGGIRCEKATSFMQQEGFQDVYQVQGGILKYLEDTKKHNSEKDNYFHGDCFVFDYRVALDKNLEQAQYALCYHCWHTLTAEDLSHKDYIINKHCQYCISSQALPVSP